jgi:protein-S-isoprenylcysteine O-methyltransferase Ste14
MTKYILSNWSAIPTVIFALAGGAVSIHEVVYLHQKVFQTPALAGGVLIVFGTVLELIGRLTLIKRAGFSGLNETKRLLITDDHHLITDGIFGHIRHPIYFGRMILSHFGFALLFFSLWGAVLMAIAALFCLLRIRVEEEMLTEEFGDAYREYQKHTKMVIPYIY